MADLVDMKIKKKLENINEVAKLLANNFPGQYDILKIKFKNLLENIPYGKFINYSVNKKIIDQKQFDTNIGNSIFDFIDSNIIKFSGSLQHLYSNNYLNLIDKYYYFYENRLNKLNLNYLQFKTRYLYKTYILNKFTMSETLIDCLLCKLTMISLCLCCSFILALDFS